MKRYDKLVRDKVVAGILRKGGGAEWHIAGKREYKTKLMRKLQEEVREFLRAENLEEMADVLDVLEAICILKGFSTERVKAARRKKAREKGKFKDRIILERS